MNSLDDESECPPATSLWSHAEEDWSDSEEGDERSDVETLVLLGIPAGAIEKASELSDAAVSRIGGLPAFLPSIEPPFASSSCKVCGTPMELLIQIWCPVEESPMDRALYVWVCAPGEASGTTKNTRSSCSKKKKTTTPAIEKLKSPQVNPFSADATTIPAASPFGLGTQIFGTDVPPASAAPEEADSDSSSDDEELLTAVATVTLDDSPWRSAPSFPAVYIDTHSEYLPPASQSRLPPGVQIVDPQDDSAPTGNAWTSESYENSLDIDQVFQRFTKRVEYEGKQCLRYDLGGTPLPYAADSVFDLLFPVPPSPPKPVTKAAFTVTPTVKRVYDPNAVPPCPVCKAERVFECQLMPNAINVVRAAAYGTQGKNKAKMTDEERRKLVEQELKRGAGTRGMEWGSCLVFSCSKDCALDDDARETRDVWREEMVFVQWGV
ncbi:PDCD2-C domain-containing protein [Mycena kentingensis (nom. inval.)]|nr:PDCD2-C domain-containing protein [Mycena kentingensis (nom. inval.)]